MKKKFTHIENDSPSMVDVAEKAMTTRKAIARVLVRLPKALKDYIKDGALNTLKGPVFQTAIIAGIQAAKKTPELIPLCHHLNLNKVTIDIRMKEPLQVEIICEARCSGKTGVEMEALTVYDMCKALSHNIVIEEIRLLKKAGGKSNFDS